MAPTEQQINNFFTALCKYHSECRYGHSNIEVTIIDKRKDKKEEKGECLKTQ